jgi:hypothetical protein
LSNADIYFIANSSNQPIQTKASFRISGMPVQCWNPFTDGAVTLASVPNGERTEAWLDLAPYGSTVLVFSKAFEPAPLRPKLETQREMDISAGWKVTFRGLNLTVEYPRLRSWTEDERTRFYSGEATYAKTIDIPHSLLQGAREVLLDFGPGMPIDPEVGGALGMRALLESPVHESAVIYVNGNRAGSVWHPPYLVDLHSFLGDGPNELKIVVGNTAINEMAGHASPDYRLLNLRYGERFVPQDVKELRPLSSGIAGVVRLSFR